MTFYYLIPVALGMGVIGLGVFLWSLRSGQYEDLDGAAERILLDEDDVPVTDKTLDPLKGASRPWARSEGNKPDHAALAERHDGVSGLPADPLTPRTAARP